MQKWIELYGGEFGKRLTDRSIVNGNSVLTVHDATMHMATAAMQIFDAMATAANAETGEHMTQATTITAMDMAAQFGQLYAILDGIREDSRRAERIASRILEHRDLEYVEQIATKTNAAIGLVLDANRRMIHQAKNPISPSTK